MNLPAPTAASLIVTVDTEEEGLWSGGFRARNNTVKNITGLDRFQQLCDRFNVRPTYLVDTPVVEDHASARKLRGFHDQDRCEIGAHLHPWCAAPFKETVNAFNSYMCNLSPSLQRAKLEGLTEVIEDRFGRRPTSFRAGRYGLAAIGAKHLAELGYLVDSSVLPYTPPESDGGPDHRGAPDTPYFPAVDDLLRPGEQRELLEVPIAAGFSHRDFKRAAKIWESFSQPPIRWFKVNGVLDAINLLRYIKFTPEFNNFVRLRQLIDAYMANQAPCLVCMLHSSSLAVGCSPYARTESDLERIYATIHDVFEYCLGQLGMKPATLSEFASEFVAGGAQTPHQSHAVPAANLDRRKHFVEST